MIIACYDRLFRAQSEKDAAMFIANRIKEDAPQTFRVFSTYNEAEVLAICPDVISIDGKNSLVTVHEHFGRKLAALIRLALK